MQDALIGAVLAQYELHERLGFGGAAIVYRGFQPSLGREVAVKVLPLDRVADPTLPERFRREARLAASLLHPNIVPVYDFGEWDDYLCIVMALVPGGTLKERLGTSLPIETAVHLIGQVADALSYAHAQGVLHRDVKPGNVLLARPDWAMLGDFGIARALSDSTPLTNPSGTIGTPIYMAPEQWLGEEIDGRADIYSLGGVLYELLAGQPPFTATSIGGLMAQHLEAPVPLLPRHGSDSLAPFDEVVQTALAKRPEHRYPDAATFKSALKAAACGEPGISQTSRMPAGPNPGWWRPPAPAGTRAQPQRQPWGQPPTQSASAYADRHHAAARSISPLILALLLACAVLVAGGTGYLLAGGRLRDSSVQDSGTASTPPTATLSSQPAIATGPAANPAAPAPQPAPTLLPAPIAQPATTSAPSATPPAAPAAAAGVPDPRFAALESHITNYFAALNNQDYASAQAACCTPRWRAQFPVDTWQRNFSGVTDLHVATPFRYTTVEPGRVVVETDYSFRSGGAQRFFTLRWTFVPVGQDWLADDAVAFAQQR